MKRADEGLAFILRYENVAWYENGTVRILDRRIYPIRTEFVVCCSHTEVAQAITDMVTQSGGPYSAAAMGMVLAVYESRGLGAEVRREFLQNAVYTLTHARPTTVAKMEYYVDRVYMAAMNALECGVNAVEAAFEQALEDIDNRYRTYTEVGKNLASIIPFGGSILTQCWAETVIGTTLRELRARGNEISVFCAETRPYFQGARLTASCVKDMGFDVTVICDNMPGYTIKQKKISLFTSAADVICIDGHIVNKVGTFQIALAAKYWGIPYYATGIPNRSHPKIDTVQIEERNGDDVLYAMDQRVAMPGVHGYYPAFDITPPELLTGLVTDKGILKPTEFHTYFGSREK